MKKIWILIVLLMTFGNVYAAAPSRPYSYSSGSTISSTQANSNENTIFTYLQSGVDTYAAGSVTQAALSAALSIPYSELNLSNSIKGSDILTTTGLNVANIGIGSSVPQAKLDVEGTAYFNGNVGIGTSAPQQKMDVEGMVYTTEGVKFLDGTILTSTSFIKTPVAKSLSTVYQASTAGFAVMWSTSTGTLEIDWGTQNPPTSYSSIQQPASGNWAYISVPIPKGYYYKLLNASPATGTPIYLFIPIS